VTNRAFFYLRVIETKRPSFALFTSRRRNKHVVFSHVMRKYSSNVNRNFIALLRCVSSFYNRDILLVVTRQT